MGEAAREPTMEEILSSIRRIVNQDSGEPQQAAADDVSSRPNPPAEAAPRRQPVGAQPQSLASLARQMASASRTVSPAPEAASQSSAETASNAAGRPSNPEAGVAVSQSANGSAEGAKRQEAAAIAATAMAPRRVPSLSEIARNVRDANLAQPASHPASNPGNHPAGQPAAMAAQATTPQRTPEMVDVSPPAEKMAAQSGVQTPERRLADIAANLARQKASAPVQPSSGQSNGAVSASIQQAKPVVPDTVSAHTKPEAMTQVSAMAKPVQPGSPSAGSQKEVDAFREALVSPSVEKAVSGSIERLKKNFSDHSAAQVEAVLRPMLREWLDDNLPSLVERIVRDEISRIAAASVSAQAAE